MAVVLTADCGGTRIKLGLVRAGVVLERAQIPAHAEGGLGPRLDEIRGLWDGFCRHHGVRPDAAGIALPQLVPPAGRPVAVNGKYPDTPTLDMAGWARQNWQIPLTLMNDAQAAVVGEWRSGAGRDYADIVMITLGTGIGGGVVSGGRLLKGHANQAALFGCMVAHVDEVTWLTVEEVMSAAALPKAARQDAGFFASLLARASPLDFAALFHAAAAGDALASRLQDRALALWSAVVVNAIHAYDPAVVILGGGVMASAETILPAIRQRVADHAIGGLARVRIEATRLGDDAGLIGIANAAILPGIL